MQAKLGEMVIVTGYCTKDAELKYVGESQKPLTVFSMSVGKRQDTTTIFVDCKAWQSLAYRASGIHKGDSVFAVGRLSEREYNGKTYTDISLEYYDFIPKETAPEDVIPVPTSATAPNGKPLPSGVIFEEDKSEAELPF